MDRFGMGTKIGPYYAIHTGNLVDRLAKAGSIVIDGDLIVANKKVVKSKGAATDLTNNTTTETQISTVDGSQIPPLGLGSSWYHIIHMHHYDNNGYDAQIAVGLSDNTTFKFRSASAGSWGSWYTIWHSGNFDATGHSHTYLVDTGTTLRLGTGSEADASYMTSLGQYAGQSTDSSASYSTFVGYKAGRYIDTQSSTTVGYRAGECWTPMTTAGYNVCLGAQAGYHPTQLLHGHNTYIGYQSGYDHPGEGNIALGSYSLQTNNRTDYSIGIGLNALQGHGACNYMIGIGYNAGQTGSGIYAVMIGNNAGKNNTSGYLVAIGKDAGVGATGSAGVFVGSEAGQNGGGGHYNVGIGSLALANLTSGDSNVALGRAAGYALQSGAQMTSVHGTICIGSDSKVSGSYQAQIGASNVTTYVYGTVQNRSDRRDKTDIEDLGLGLEFINNLRPVSYVWDYREDYQEVEFVEEIDEDGNAVTISNVIYHPKDGSRKRKRKHHGVIAQEVKEVMDKLGVDFGGYQDHSINGGDDVLSIGYDEFVGPLIKAIQELSAEVNILKTTVAELSA